MNDARFWEIVTELGWGTKSTDYKTMRTELAARLTVEEAQAFEEHFDRLDGALAKRLDASHLDFGVGDDGFDDLCAHIVGLGEVEYRSVIADPKVAQERGRAHLFQESFRYVFLGLVEEARAPESTPRAPAAEDPAESEVEALNTSAIRFDSEGHPGEPPLFLAREGVPEGEPCRLTSVRADLWMGPRQDFFSIAEMVLLRADLGYRVSIVLAAEALSHLEA